MAVEAWLASFGEQVADSEYRISEAAALASFVRLYGAEASSFIETRRRGEQELVVLDVRTGAPQLPVYAIRRVERIGVLFAAANIQPLVTMLRDDSPIPSISSLFRKDTLPPSASTTAPGPKRA